MISYIVLIALIAVCTADIEVGTLTSNTYRDAYVIIVYDKTGLKMCGRYCKTQESCVSINYNPETLVCELLKAGGTSITRAGNLYSSDITSWSMDNNSCNPNPCTEESKCMLSVSGGYYCLSLLPPCTGIVCQHGGMCKNGLSSFVCQCTFGISGTYCETTPCSSDPCLNSGTCSFSGTTYSCACTHGYYGTECQSHSCSPNPCLNGGGCTSTGGSSYSCACSSGWYGSTCNSHACSPNPCLNGGFCTSTGGSSYSCACSTGWYGSTCNSNPCSPTPCYNAGTCTDTGATTYNCACTSSFTGATCQVNKNSCSGRCVYDANYNCQCDSACTTQNDCCADKATYCP